MRNGCLPEEGRVFVFVRVSPSFPILPLSSSTQGLKFDVVVSKFDENLDKSQFVGGADYAQATATHKAMEVATRMEKEERLPFMVIGADTVVEAPDGSIMEKPKVWTSY